MKLKTLTIIVSSALVTGLILIGGAAWAIAQGNNIIYACVAKDGALRVVALEGQCKDKETPLNWNIQGVQGEQGIQGEQGPPGVLGFYTVYRSDVLEGPISVWALSVSCDDGDVVTGGGHENLGFETVTSQSRPIDANADGISEGWSAASRFDIPEGQTGQMAVHAICADLTP